MLVEKLPILKIGEDGEEKKRKGESKVTSWTPVREASAYIREMVHRNGRPGSEPKSGGSCLRLINPLWAGESSLSCPSINRPHPPALRLTSYKQSGESGSCERF